MKGMIKMYELINDIPLRIKEYKGQRVVTFKDIDKVHNRPEGTARRNFNTNREYFVEGEDFFIVNQPNEIRTLGITRPQGGTPSSVILLTENGYLMLVKSFTDKLAWNVQRQIVKTYFRAKEMTSSYNEVLLQLIKNQKVLERKIDTLEENIESYSYNLFREVIDAVIVPCFISLSNKIESTSVKSVRTFRKRIDTLMKKIK